METFTVISATLFLFELVNIPAVSTAGFLILKWNYVHIQDSSQYINWGTKFIS